MLFSSKKNDTLQKTQENLEKTQENLERMLMIIENHNDNKYSVKSMPTVEACDIIEKVSLEDKKKAAYALNLCTVSVSQIIDYNDIRILESEYEAILNNLNLEKMPKDEALLSILKQLLDVITFFRIQEGEKKMLEKEYTRRIKDAIWSSIPNLSVVVAGGNPVTMAFSLAAQVGIGYMNYRKEKSKIEIANERTQWELQRSAIEQFNGLRRELFDTAWRLADEYDFPDEFRLTENQISQFNYILLDDDQLRKYERLDYIKDKFEAYPPFWYYLGNAANLVYQDEFFDEKTRNCYKKLAVEHFDKFLKLTEGNILREDQLIASCALEKFDLIEDPEEKIALLERASRESGNALDVLQICAISYLKIGESNKSCKLLRMLVNERYNETLNAQLLSKLYVYEISKGNTEYEAYYETLKGRVYEPQYLFPQIEGTNSLGAEKNFLLAQKENLLKRYADVLSSYASKCEKEYAEICSREGNIASLMAELIKNASVCVSQITGKDKDQNPFIKHIKEEIYNPEFIQMLENSNEREKGVGLVSFEKIFGAAFKNIATEIKQKTCGLITMGDISAADTMITEFIINNNVDFSEQSFEQQNFDSKRNSLDELFGDKFVEKLEINQKLEGCLEFLKEKGFCDGKILDANVKNDGKVRFITKTDPAFDTFVKKKKFNDQNKIFAILDVGSFGHSLIFRIDKLIYDKKEIEYKDVTKGRKDDTLDLYGKKFKNNCVVIHELYEMIESLAKYLKESDSAKGDTNVSDSVKKIILQSN